MRITTSIAFILICCAPLFLQAQIVNIESSRIQTDTTGWAGSMGASMSVEKNTSKIIIVGLEAHLQYKTQKDLWLLLGDHNFLKRGEQKFVSNSFIHFRYNRKINNWLRWEAFSQVQNNIITQIRSRFLIGTGPRFKIFSSKKFRFYAASLLMYEHETEKTSPAVVHNDIRNSSYFSFTFLPKGNDDIELVSTTFYQPLLKNFSDSRIYSQSVLQMRTGRHFGIQLKYNYLYDRRPAGTAPNTTYYFMTGFSYRFEVPKGH